MDWFGRTSGLLAQDTKASFCVQEMSLEYWRLHINDCFLVAILVKLRFWKKKSQQKFRPHRRTSMGLELLSLSFFRSYMLTGLIGLVRWNLKAAQKIYCSVEHGISRILFLSLGSVKLIFSIMSVNCLLFSSNAQYTHVLGIRLRNKLTFFTYYFLKWKNS